MIYEYKCPHCWKVFEVDKKMADPDPTECPFQKDHRPLTRLPPYVLIRVYSPPGVQFKGSGFHVNEYKKTESSNE
jgi:putative FmdB family regulatory protein